MKLAVISDTHFGDESTSLVNHHTLEEGEKFQDFLRVAGDDNDYLVLLGDIFDFAITSYDKSYKVAQAFFYLLQKHHVAKSIIYVPGNHDFSIWHTIQHQVNIIHQLQKGKLGRAFTWSAPGIIDLRSDAKKYGFYLPKNIDGIINPENSFSGDEPLFLNSITINENKTGNPTTFYVVYPNLYFINNSVSILLTHGQYLEGYWSMAGERIRKITKGDLNIGSSFDIEECVALNLPSSQLACSGIGQAGPLTEIVNTIQHEVKRKDLKRLKRYLNNLDAQIDDLSIANMFKPKTVAREILTDLVSNTVKDEIIKAVENMKSTRYDQDFFIKPEVRQRLIDYYQATRAEIDQLVGYTDNQPIPYPSRIIFGHTHYPIPYENPNPISETINNVKVTLHNTGGWLWRENEKNQKEFCGAEVFILDDSKVTSTRIH